MVDKSMIAIIIVYSFQFLLTVGLLVIVSREYVKKRYKTVLYLTIATAILLIFQITSSITQFIGPNFINPGVQNPIFPASYMSLIESSALISIFCLILFFESFLSQAVLTRRNTIMMLVITILSTGLLVTGFITENIVSSFISTIPTGNENAFSFLNIEIFVEPILESLRSEMGFIVYIYLVFTFTGLLLNFGMAGLLLVQFFGISRKTDHFLVKKTTNRMAITAVMVVFIPLILTGVFISNLAIQLGILCISFGIVIFFIFYKIGGMYIIQSRSLRRLLIINSAGIPVYSYIFQHFDTSISDYDEDVLFSGALSALSTLIMEFTGTQHSIEEIFFKNLLMMIKQAKEFSVVLIADQSTYFFKEALESFCKQLYEKVPDIIPEYIFTDKQRHQTTLLLEQQLGVGGREDISLLKNLQHVSSTS